MISAGCLFPNCSETPAEVSSSPTTTRNECNSLSTECLNANGDITDNKETGSVNNEGKNNSHQNEEKAENVHREGFPHSPVSVLNVTSTCGSKRERETSVGEGYSAGNRLAVVFPTSISTLLEETSLMNSISSPAPTAPVSPSPQKRSLEVIGGSPSPLLSPSPSVSSSTSRDVPFPPFKTFATEALKPVSRTAVGGTRASSLSQRIPIALSSSSSSSVHLHLSKTPQQLAAVRAEKWGKALLPVFLQERDESQREALYLLCQRIAMAVPGDKMVARDHFMTLLGSLKDPLNTELREKLVSGVMPVEVLVNLSEKELANPERRREMEEGFKERSKDTNLQEIANALKTTSTLFPCPNCKARDCSWVQRQTRSGDEPMTVICSCNRCNHQWRKF